ncbi:MAG: hypothetical protein ACOXZK_09960 [Bacteroidales bacterium]|mgnify:CR=1 FL=1|nr:hypothetical protein [Clostridiaceae bacterium]
MRKIISVTLFIAFTSSLFAQRKISEPVVFSLENEQLNISKTLLEQYKIIYYSEPVCSECVTELVNMFNIYKIPFLVVVEDRNDIIYRKVKTSEFLNKSEYIKGVYFDKTMQKNSFKKLYKLSGSYPILIFYSKKLRAYDPSVIFEKGDGVVIRDKIIKECLDVSK